MEYKAKGNDAYASEQKQEAIKFYSDGIDWLSSGSLDASTKEGKGAADAAKTAPTADDKGCLHLLYSNRSMVRLDLCNVEGALQDADAAIAANPDYAKAYTRRAAALNATFRFQEALLELVKAEKLEPALQGSEHHQVATGGKWIPNCYLQMQIQHQQSSNKNEATGGGSQQTKKKQQHHKKKGGDVYIVFSDRSSNSVLMTVTAVDPPTMQKVWLDAFTTGSRQAVQQLLAHVLYASDLATQQQNTQQQQGKGRGGLEEVTSLIKEQFTREFGPRSQEPLPLDHTGLSFPSMQKVVVALANGPAGTIEDRLSWVGPDWSSIFNTFDKCRHSLFEKEIPLGKDMVKFLTDTTISSEWKLADMKLMGTIPDTAASSLEPIRFVLSRHAVISVICHIFIGFQDQADQAALLTHLKAVFGLLQAVMVGGGGNATAAQAARAAAEEAQEGQQVGTTASYSSSIGNCNSNSNSSSNSPTGSTSSTGDALATNGARHYLPIVSMISFLLQMHNRTVADYIKWVDSLKAAQLANELSGPLASPRNSVGIMQALTEIEALFIKTCDFLLGGGGGGSNISGKSSATTKKGDAVFEANFKALREGHKSWFEPTTPSPVGVLVAEEAFFLNLGKALVLQAFVTLDQSRSVVDVLIHYRRLAGQDEMDPQ